MSTGLIVADIPSSELLGLLGKRCGQFRPLPANQRSVDPRTEGAPFLAGDAHGFGYLLDLSHTLLPSCQAWDVLASVASEAKATVLCTDTDPIETHYELMLATGITVERLYWNAPTRVRCPFSRGQPLPSEAEVPLDAPKGRGLTRVLQDLGFELMDYEVGLSRTADDYLVCWQEQALETREIGKTLNDHIRQNLEPSYRPPTPAIEIRKS